jgi:hypothetical protein
MSKNLLLIVLVGIFLGCSTVGRQFNTNAVNNIDVGKTTESDVISLVGVPMSNNKLSNGMIIYDYSYGVCAPFEIATSIATLQVQFYNGIVINKWQRLANY